MRQTIGTLLSDDHSTELVEVSRSRTRAAAEQQALVLAAVGISSRLVMADDAATLYVSALEAARARRELSHYARENAPTRRPLLPAVAALYRIEGALAYAAVLLFFFAAARRHALSIDWVAAGAAQAGLIQDGAWWRTITALCLHVELDHLMSNLAFGAVAGVLVAQFLGTGLGWLAILLAGALGNGLNAALHGAGQQDREPGEPGADELGDQHARDCAEGQVAHQMIELDMEAERRDRAPPGAVLDEARLRRAGRDPVDR